MISPSLSIPSSQWVASNLLAFAIGDDDPVSPGHTLVIPRRAVSTWFEATREEQLAILELVEVVKSRLDAQQPRPDGYNVGFNSGEAAGQVVPHLHMHVIPRYHGDACGQWGGVRNVIPGKSNYLRRPSPLSTGGLLDPFLEHIRPLIQQANEVAIVAAFVQDSGLRLLQGLLSDALRRGAHVRILTSDYLNITQAEALVRLLDWIEEIAAGLPGEEEGQDRARPWGLLEGSVIEVANLASQVRSFHPKSWRFQGPQIAAAFVGSSNMSHTALTFGIEWNLRVDRDRDSVAYQRIVEAFDACWDQALPLTAEWVKQYGQRARQNPVPLPPWEQDPPEQSPPIPMPHMLQLEALAALAEARQQGRRRALVVLATGLGKTLLAALDVNTVRQERGSLPRVLFLAHRAELLRQAQRTFRWVLERDSPGARFTFCAGKGSDLSGDIVLGSVQKLSQPEVLKQLGPDLFDYVIVDEVHHGDAPSYRRVLARLEPGFLLGLTATPDRADQGDILGLLDDFTAFRADLGTGIEHRLLVPFAYHGIKDDVHYENIPWRNRRFDPTYLVAAVATEQRMERLWQAWQEHPGTRTLIFCCTIEHANFARDWFQKKGVRVEAVHSAEGSYDRDRALDELGGGQVDALCSVDLFNEGVDVPRIDRVVMLRPTESPVVFLQQLGRGLRVAAGKERLVVIDFVGNHRIFLDRFRTLLAAAGSSAPSVRDFLMRQVPLSLPHGCTVDVQVEALDLLSKLFPTGGTGVQLVYRELREIRGRRPTPTELWYMHHNPAVLRDAHGGWFDFVKGEGDLNEAEQRVLNRASSWFATFERTQMTTCLMMVVLDVLLDAEALQGGLPLAELARRSHDLLVRSPGLFIDIEHVKDLKDPRDPGQAEWLAYFRDHPIKDWLDGKGGRRWFRLDGDRLVPELPIPPGDEAVFADMTRELIEYRLAKYRARTKDLATGKTFECKVLWNKRDPILKLPPRNKRPDLPVDETAVRLPDGSVWQFRFAKEYCNVASPAGTRDNRLPGLLQGWFGPDAGHPGTDFHVCFSSSPEGWWIKPVERKLFIHTPRKVIIAYPTLRAAAGSPGGAQEGEPQGEEIHLPVERTGAEFFAVRATGDSMDGGSRPIRNGDWLVMRLTNGAELGAVRDQVTLLEIPEESAGQAYQRLFGVLGGQNGGKTGLLVNTPSSAPYG